MKITTKETGILIVLTISSLTLFYLMKDSFKGSDIVFNLWISNEYSIRDQGKVS